jgi:Holliday junction resolvase
MSILKAAEAERLVAKKYEDLGYAVTTEPSLSAIPFSLAGYQPDILAEKENEHLLIEVKRASSKVDTRRFLLVDEEVSRHPGWKFLIVTIADEELDATFDRASANLHVEEVRQHLQLLDQLPASGASTGLLLPQLWAAYSVALRLLLDRQGISLERQTDLSLINRAYSEGLLSFDEHEAARRFLSLRNESAHRLNPVVTEADWRELRSMADTLVERLEDPPRS